MCLKRINIYKDASECFTPFKYLGLSVYSLPKRGQKQHMIVTKKSIAIAIICLIVAAITLMSCNLFCFLGKKDFDLYGNIAYTFIDLELIAVVVNSHFQSGSLVKIFKRFTVIDKKLLILTGNTILIMKKDRIVRWVWRFKCALLVFLMIVDGVLLWHSQVSIRIICCVTIPHISNVWRMQSGSLYMFFINESTERVRYISSFIETMLLLKQRIACIETSITPKSDVYYKLEEAQHLMTIILDLVTKINRTFQFHLLIKLLHVSGILLLAAYYLTNMYLFNKNLSAVASVYYSLYIVCHTFVQFLDVISDIWTYKKLQCQVTIYNIYKDQSILLLLQVDLVTERFDKAYNVLHTISVANNKQVKYVV